IEYRLPTETRLGAMLGIKEYPTPTVVGLYNALLSAPFPFVLTQSFAFLTKATAQGLLQRQSARMANAGDFAVTQAAELTDALDALVNRLPRLISDRRPKLTRGTGLFSSSDLFLQRQ